MVMVRYTDLVVTEGRDFRLVHSMYTDRGYEYFFEHGITGLKIRLTDAQCCLFGGNRAVSIVLPMDKIKLFHL